MTCKRTFPFPGVYYFQVNPSNLRKQDHKLFSFYATVSLLYEIKNAVHCG